MSLPPPAHSSAAHLPPAQAGAALSLALWPQEGLLPRFPEELAAQLCLSLPPWPQPVPAWDSAPWISDPYERLLASLAGPAQHGAMQDAIWFG